MPTLHIALIGCGRWGQYILRDLKSLGCEVTVVCRSEQSLLRAKKFNADHTLSHWQQLPTSLDGIIIATPTSNHYQMIKNLASKAVPILVEKTMALTEAEGKALLFIADRLFVTNKFRYHNGIQLLKEISLSEQLGKPLGLTTKGYRWGINHNDVDAIEILVPHELSIIFEIQGKIPALKQAVMTRWHEGKIHLQAYFEDNLWAQFDVNSYSFSPMREVKLVCEKGIAMLSGVSTDKIITYSALDKQTLVEEEIETIPFVNTPPLYQELKVFTDYLQGGPKPKTNAHDAYKQICILSELRNQCMQLG